MSPILRSLMSAGSCWCSRPAAALCAHRGHILQIQLGEVPTSNRHMASANVATDPVQKLFVEKVREFKASNKGLDDAHKKALEEEMARLKRVYKVDDENKLSQLDYKFSSEQNVSLHDIDESRDKRYAIDSGEYQKQLEVNKEPTSALLASIPDQTMPEFGLPPHNKPDLGLIFSNHGVPRPPALNKELHPDYEFVGEKMTPDKLERDINVIFSKDMPTIHDDKAPTRDTVNFPREQQPLDTPPTRFHIIPESWFTIFYPKTGVTGPYTFGVTLFTFLMSKEWVVYEHEFISGMALVCIFAYGLPKYGPIIMKWARGEIDREVKGWEKWRLGHIEFLEKLEEHYKGQIGQGDILKELYSARSQDVETQVECEYRNRLRTIYEDTKRRLNYLVAVADSQRQVNHSNLVNWVISNAISSIGQKQESEVLDNCILNLRKLATKNANVV